jgi:lipid-A-disaccharide synthase-like uncharacterized protein
VRWVLAGILLWGLLGAPAPALGGPPAGSPTPADSASRAAARPTAEPPLRLDFQPPGVDEIELAPRPGGGYSYRVTFDDGRTRVLSPDAFSELVYRDLADRSRLYAILNITSPIGIAWVTFGFLGQIFFALRMVVQWLASERERRSVIPISFWWLSLVAATMLMVYFIWRKDIVGVAGQATGWLIYVRNLWLIHRSEASVA